MHIQGRKLKEGKEPQKGVLNEFTDSRIITFTEPEVGDVVDVEYQLTEGDKGYFAEEYRPDTIAKEDAKVIDITACIINEKAGMSDGDFDQKKIRCETACSPGDKEFVKEYIK